MTLKYKRVPTVYSVYRAIVAEHAESDMSVYESFTDIVENGRSKIYTVWGLRSASVALVGAETTYESELAYMSDGVTIFDKEIEGTRKSVYWLCAPYESEE